MTSAPRTPSTGPDRSRRLGSVPFASVVRQARADAAPLCVGALVVALVAFLTAVVPRVAATVSTDEIRAAVSDPTSQADVVVTVPLSEGFVVPRPLLTGTADDTAWVADFLNYGLPSVFADPVTGIVSRDLQLGMVDDRPGVLQLAYVQREGAPSVEWIAGTSPGEADGASIAASDGLPFPVEIGFSEDVARALDAAVGDTLTVKDPNGRPLDLIVAGIFRPVDASDAQWGVAPTLVEPHVVEGVAARTEFAAMLSGESLPYARLALDQSMLTRTFTFAVDPQKLDASNASDVATSIRRIAAGSDDIGTSWLSSTLRTRLDSVLDSAVARVDSASAQASLILVGVLATALVVVLLAAGLVLQRRSNVIMHQRSHGASVPSIVGAFLLESAIVTAIAGAVGVLVAGVVVPGPVSWSWVAPPLVFTTLAGPCLGAWAASRRMAPPPARRLDSRPGIRSAAARRLALEATVLVLAVGSFTALRSRGVGASAESLGADVVVLAAPVLVAITVTLVLLRVLPPFWRWARRVVKRTRGAVPVLAAARTRTVGLPLTAIVLSTSLLAITLAMDSTVRVGQVDGSWDAVGADVAVTMSGGASLPAEAAQVGDQAGVDAAVFALIDPGSQVLGDGVDMAVRVVVVDAPDLQALLAASPLPDAPQLALLSTELSTAGTLDEPTAGTADEPTAIPVLTSGVPGNASDLRLQWRGATLPISIVGKAPAVPGDGTSGPPTVFVDRATISEAMGTPVEADTLWVVGKGADQAVRDALGTEDATITTRLDWLAERRDAPVTAAIAGLLLGAAAVLAALAGLVVGLVASTGARGRANALASFRVLGLPRRQANRVAIGEMLAPALIAAVAGTATGALLVSWLVQPLDLAALTGQYGAPTPILPWWCWAPILVLAGAVLVAVALELIGHRRERLGQVMRMS